MKKQLNERHDVPDMLYGKGQESYDRRLDKLNKNGCTVDELLKEE